MKRLGLAIAIAAMMLSFAVMAYSENDFTADDLRTFTGKVTEIDSVKSIVTVKGIGVKTFPISSDTTITKDGAAAELNDIEIDDYVAIGYYARGEEPIKVLTVRVEYGAREDIW